MTTVLFLLVLFFLYFFLHWTVTLRESSLSGREEERSEPADTILQTVSIARGAHMVHVVPLCVHTHTQGSLRGTPKPGLNFPRSTPTAGRIQSSECFETISGSSHPKLLFF